MSTPISDRERYDPYANRSFSDLANDPEFRVTVDEVAAQKKAALADPGPPWKEWFLRSASKWYIGLGLLILDSWVVGTWLGYGLYLPILPSLAAALYAEYLLWQYLWYRPEEYRRGQHRRLHGSRWLHPVPYGRWTAEGESARLGRQLPVDQPDPGEFL